MVFTGRQLIDRALRDIKYLGIGRSLVDRDASDALLYLQELVDWWKVKRLSMYQVVPQDFTLTSAVSSYNIGPGLSSPHFAYDPKPIFLASVRVIPVGETIEQVVDIWTKDRYLAEPNKAMTDLYPRALWMQLGNTYNTFKTWPVPTTAATLRVGIPTGLNAFVDLSTSYTFPEGYHRAFRTRLALTLARPFSKPVTADLVADAEEAFSDIAKVNDTGPPTLASNPSLRPRGSYDVTLDDYLNPR